MPKVNVSVDAIYEPNKNNTEITTVFCSFSAIVDNGEGPEVVTERFFRSVPTASISFYEEHLAAGTQFTMTTEKYDFKRSEGEYTSKKTGEKKWGVTTWVSSKL